MKTKVFKNFDEFLAREDKSVNGVSPDFFEKHYKKSRVEILVISRWLDRPIWLQFYLKPERFWEKLLMPIGLYSMKKDNKTNIGCWNCYRCTECKYCSKIAGHNNKKFLFPLWSASIEDLKRALEGTITTMEKQ